MPKYTVRLVIHNVEASSPEEAALNFQEMLRSGGTRWGHMVIDEDNRVYEVLVDYDYYETELINPKGDANSE